MPTEDFEDPDWARELDRVCDRFEAQWQAGQQPKIEDFLSASSAQSAANSTALLRQLLLSEWQCFSAGGDKPDLLDYEGRFPDHKPLLRSAWAEHLEQVQDESSKPVAGRADTVSSTVDLRRGEAAQEQVGLTGDRLGRYQILRLLGEGSFGQVYLAHDDQLRRDVAIKVPSPKLISRWRDAPTFMAEARTLAELDHPNIVPVYDVGSTSACPCYVVSKFIDGPDLSQLLKTRPPNHREATILTVGIARALAFAHAKKIVHRDIKPANILIDAQGRPHVADFGLALDEESYGNNQGIVGTPAYMSPEQVNQAGHLVDGRSDIFSLGVLFYQMLTGERPFGGVDAQELMQRIATVEVRPPRQLDSTIPPELERVCLKALSKQVVDRFSAAGDMAAELEQWLQANSTVDDRKREYTGAASSSSGSRTQARQATAQEVRQSDIVINSAQLDNQTLSVDDVGWVSRFENDLRVRMEQLLGESIQVASLPMPANQSALDDTVVDAIGSAKTLVSVMSPSFTKSHGCLESVKQFYESAERSGALCVDDKPRMFKVMKSPVANEDVPADLSRVFADLFGFEFYEQDPDTGRIREFDEMFGPTLKQRFHERVYDLAHDVSELLRARRRIGGGVRQARDSGDVAQVVYLATTTSDVQDERDRIRRELIERGYLVLPDSALPLSAQESERFVQNCLSKCCLAVHVLGQHYGVTPEDGEESLPALQLRLSAGHAQQNTLPRLLWMPSEADTHNPRQAEYLRQVRETPELHFRAEMIEGELTLLKSILIDRLRHIELNTAASSNAAAEPDRSGGPPRLYLLCEPRDEESIAPLEDYLFGHGLDVCLPAFDGSDAEALALHRENLATCDALMIYYGAAPRAWVDIKLRDALKAPGYGREAPLDFQSVYIAPPMDHRKERFKSLHCQVIRGSLEFESNPALSQFVASIRST